MSESFPQSIPHRPNQEGPVPDGEKAEAMATTENEYYELAKAYGEFLKDPDAFIANDPDWKLWEYYLSQSRGEAGIILPEGDPAQKFKERPYKYRFFEAYKKEGFTPEDLRILGDRMAESTGELHDFKEGARKAYDLELEYNPRVWRLLSYIHMLRSIRTTREGNVGMPLSAGKFVQAQKADVAYGKAIILERERAARVVDRSDPETAEKIRAGELDDAVALHKAFNQ